MSLNEFINKNKTPIFITLIVLIVLALYYYDNKNENLDSPNTTAVSQPELSQPGLPQPGLPQSTSTHIGKSISGICLIILAGCLLPWIIMYYITKKSARAALNKTPCASNESFKIAMSAK